MSELIEYTCPCCGGKIEFDSNKQKMLCPYCDTEFELDTLKAYDEELVAEKEDDLSWQTEAGSEWTEGEQDSLRTYVCRSCGGEIIADTTTGATTCPYCDSPVIMKEQFRGDLRPDLVIPFKLDKKAAIEALKRHTSGKKLLPKIFSDENHINEVKGIYVPFWLFEANANATARYKASKTRVWFDSRYKYLETLYFLVVREGNLDFEKVPVDGSSKMDDAMMESLEPFDSRDAVDFNTAYLSGYLADRYDVDTEESITRANERIKKSTEAALRDTVRGYSSVVPENTSVRLNHSGAKYALYPVWILNTEYRGKKYTFAMNGQTGKFVGNLPVDKLAAAKWFGAIFGLATLAAFAIQYILWLF